MAGRESACGYVSSSSNEEGSISEAGERPPQRKRQRQRQRKPAAVLVVSDSSDEEEGESAERPHQPPVGSTISDIKAIVDSFFASSEPPAMQMPSTPSPLPPSVPPAATRLPDAGAPPCVAAPPIPPPFGHAAARLPVPFANTAPPPAAHVAVIPQPNFPGSNPYIPGATVSYAMTIPVPHSSMAMPQSIPVPNSALMPQNIPMPQRQLLQPAATPMIPAPRAPTAAPIYSEPQIPPQQAPPASNQAPQPAVQTYQSGDLKPGNASKDNPGLQGKVLSGEKSGELLTKKGAGTQPESGVPPTADDELWLAARRRYRQAKLIKDEKEREEFLRKTELPKSNLELTLRNSYGKDGATHNIGLEFHDSKLVPELKSRCFTHDSKRLATFRHDQRAAQRGNQKRLKMFDEFPICRTYLRTRNCPYGSQCRQSHDLQAYSNFQTLRARTGHAVRTQTLAYDAFLHRLMQNEILHYESTLIAALAHLIDKDC